MERIRNRLNSRLASEQFSYPELRNMFLTLTLDQFFIFFISMLSTAMVSSVGEAAIAAVSMVGTINGMVSLMFTSLATGGAIVVALAKGRGDLVEIRRAIGEVTGLCCAASILLSAMLYASAELLVGLLYPDVEPLLVEYAVRYMRLISISFVPYSVFCAIFNIFRNLGDTRSSLLLTIVINVSHLMLSMLFINGLHLGVTGSGLSYTVARTAGMLMVQVYLARLTTTDLAAHAVANSMLNLYNTTSGALNALTGTVCGQCFGARLYDLTRRYCRNLIFVGRFILLATVVVLYPFTPLLLKLYGATEQGAAIIRTALSIAVFCMPLFWCDGYIPAMVLRVAGDGVYTGAVAVAALLLGRCLLGYVLTIPMGLGVPGVWIALVFEWIFRAIALHIRFRGDRWLHIRQEAGS